MSAEGAKTAEARSGAQVFVGDIPQAPFGPESFDVITTCFDVLEHAAEPRQMAKVGVASRAAFSMSWCPTCDLAEARVFGSYCMD